MAIPAIITLAFSVILTICWCIYRSAFYSSPSNHPGPDTPLRGRQYQQVAEHLHRISSIMQKYPCESVWITSDDGLKLHGRYYHLHDDAPLQILFHGYRSCAFRDCSGGHALARKMGFNTLVVDQRAHGESEGRTITFGIQERLDCQKWAQYAAQRFGSGIPIVLSGLSMGASTVLMTSELDLPDNVAAIMADCPYSAPLAIIEKICQDQKYPVILCRPLLFLAAFLFGHFHLGASSATDAVRNARLPILLIHGEEDHIVPCQMSQQIQSAGGALVTLHTFPGAGHGLSYITDPLRYERVIYDFLSAIPQLSGFIFRDFLK